VKAGDRLREASRKFHPSHCRDFPDGNKLSSWEIILLDIYFLRCDYLVLEHITLKVRILEIYGISTIFSRSSNILENEVAA
jgi:hypothetical protein